MFFSCVFCKGLCNKCVAYLCMFYVFFCLTSLFVFFSKVFWQILVCVCVASDAALGECWELERWLYLQFFGGDNH